MHQKAADCDDPELEVLPDASQDLAELGDQCRKLFEGREGWDASSRRWLDDQSAQFNIWATNIGLFADGQRALLVRLSGLPEIRTTIYSLVDALKHELEREATMSFPKCICC